MVITIERIRGTRGAATLMVFAAPAFLDCRPAILPVREACLTIIPICNDSARIAAVHVARPACGGCVNIRFLVTIGRYIFPLRKGGITYEEGSRKHQCCTGANAARRNPRTAVALGGLYLLIIVPSSFPCKDVLRPLLVSASSRPHVVPPFFLRVAFVEACLVTPSRAAQAAYGSSTTVTPVTPCACQARPACCQ